MQVHHGKIQISKKKPKNKTQNPENLQPGGSPQSIFMQILYLN